MSFISCATSPALMRAACGYVWLPIGMPSGFALSFATCDASTPIAMALAPLFLKKSRLEMTSIVLLPRRNNERRLEPARFWPRQGKKANRREIGRLGAREIGSWQIGRSGAWEMGAWEMDRETG